jgi:Barrel-sandwich domain of CusB or HlyD membrane-fusion
MLANIRIEDIDQLLNELEVLAREPGTRSHFLRATLERLQFLMQAAATGFAMNPSREQWVVVSACGSLSMASFTEQLSKVVDSQPFYCSPERNRLAVPLRKKRWPQGALLVEFPKPLAETAVDEKWSGFQSLLASVAGSASSEECAYAVVNNLVGLLQADRISIVQSTKWGRQKALAISGVVHIERKATLVNEIERACKRAIVERRPYSQHSPNSNTENQNRLDLGRRGLLTNFVCIPMVEQGNVKAVNCDSALLCEWDDYESFVVGSSTLNYFFPSLAATWLQHERLVQIPVFCRRLFGWRTSRSGFPWLRRLVRLAVMVVFAYGIYWALSYPVALRIESEGTLQPTEQRIVFAAMDGVVTRLLTADGQRIERGQVLVEMRSPALELDLQSVLGDIRANAEKRNGLSLAINQLNNADPGAGGMQSKLSSEIKELEIQLTTLNERKAALELEQKKLVISSPITGVVISRQIEKFLDSRPVRHGEALFRIADLDGPWRLELLVRDQDSGYVKQKLFSTGTKTSGAVDATLGSERDVKFAMVSRPDQTFVASVTWVSESARNPKGDGMFVDVFADVDQSATKVAHVGASVNAYLECGQRPFWFVWTRPLVEAIQRRLWF